jgi:hypothetical protein
MLPLTLALRRRSPAGHATAAVRAMQDTHVSLGVSPRALQTLLVIAGLACCVAMAMPQVHIVAYCGDLGYGAANGHTASHGKRWPAPSNIHQINNLIRQRERTGRCVVCGKPAGDMGGATCKSVACIRAFVLGRMEPEN